MSYFWDDPRKPKPGLNADIERHRKELQELDVGIESAEKKTDPFSVSAVRTLRHLRAQLLQSLANTVARLGRRL